MSPTIDDYFNHYRTSPSDINEHMETLRSYASECEHITEMGVRTVVSTWAFLKGNPKRLVSIDINPSPVEEAARLAKESNISFDFLLADTSKPELDIEETDLLFIDTWHIYDQLKTEFKLHSNKAKKYIILHDTTTFGDVGEGSGNLVIDPVTNQMVSVNRKGLWPAVEEFLAENSDWTLKSRYTHNNGLTVLERVSSKKKADYNLVDFREFFISKYYNKAWLDSAVEEYNSGDPFPHIVIDNFLPPNILDAVLDKFPKPGDMDWWSFNNNNEIKLGSKNEVQIPQVARNVLAELNSGYVLDWLEIVTGVPGLIADTRLIGGGLHQIQRGGKLGVHVDFNIEPRTKMYRKLNLLIYLNKDWQDEWGGQLELWDEPKLNCIKKVAPVFNRCVLFNTNNKSWHGHPHPLNTPEDITRKSLALYYYTVGGEEENVAAHNTVF